jgi:ankyrin repeat protein
MEVNAMRRALRLMLAVLGAFVACATEAQQGATDPELVKGSRQLDEGDFENAARTLGAVVERMRAQEPRPRELARAQLQLGIAQLGLRDEKAARQSFLEVLKADRGATLSASEYPPRVIEAFEQARRELPPAPSPPPPPASPKPAAVAPAVPPAVLTTFFEAAKAGDFAVVRRLASEHPGAVNAKDEQFGASALHWAALRGHQAIVALLIAQGADVTVKNRDGEMPLHVAERAKREDVAKLLRAAAPAGSLPPDIFEAVKGGDVEATRKLLEQDPALLNKPDAAFGATPLHWAALRGHEEIVRLLVASGADINARNRDGEAPRQVAERGKRAAVVALLRQSESAADSIVEAVRAGDLTRLQLALAADPAALNRKDTRFGATPLHWAALKGHAETVKFLLSRGADAEAKNAAGETPLQVARRAGKSEVARILGGG